LGLEKSLLKLKNHEEIPVDAILCGTGWTPSLQFFTVEQCQAFGLPYSHSEESPKDKAHWAQLESDADAKVLKTFPQLGAPPPHYQRPNTHTPYRLYQQISPISSQDRSIVFIGQLEVGNYFPAVQCQAMWATAYMDGKLILPNLEEREKDVALFTTWCRRRYLSSGMSGNNTTFELVGYTDLLLQQLGLSSHRRGWFKDLFAPMVARNFAGLKEEYIRKYGCDEEHSEHSG
jgi:dimethylaniline monooxygenase (N-oxide forming)